MKLEDIALLFAVIMGMVTLWKEGWSFIKWLKPILIKPIPKGEGAVKWVEIGYEQAGDDYLLRLLVWEDFINFVRQFAHQLDIQGLESCGDGAFIVTIKAQILPLRLVAKPSGREMVLGELAARKKT